jgi:hypothetical protein
MPEQSRRYCRPLLAMLVVTVLAGCTRGSTPTDPARALTFRIDSITGGGAQARAFMTVVNVSDEVLTYSTCAAEGGSLQQARDASWITIAEKQACLFNGLALGLPASTFPPGKTALPPITFEIRSVWWRPAGERVRILLADGTSSLPLQL